MTRRSWEVSVSVQTLFRSVRAGIRGCLRSRAASHFCSWFLPFALHSLCQVCFSTRVYKIRLGLFLAETILYFLSRSALTSPFLKPLACSLNTRLKCLRTQAIVLWGQFAAAPLGPQLWQLPQHALQKQQNLWGPSKRHSHRGPDVVKQREEGKK